MIYFSRFYVNCSNSWRLSVWHSHAFILYQMNSCYKYYPIVKIHFWCSRICVSALKVSNALSSLIITISCPWTPHKGKKCNLWKLSILVITPIKYSYDFKNCKMWWGLQYEISYGKLFQITTIENAQILFAHDLVKSSLQCVAITEQCSAQVQWPMMALLAWPRTLRNVHLSLMISFYWCAINN